MSDEKTPPDDEEAEALVEEMLARGFAEWTGGWHVDDDGVRHKAYVLTPAGRAEKERLDREERL